MAETSQLPESKEFYTTRDFARWLGISTYAVMYHCRFRNFAKEGNRYRLDERDAARFLSYLLTVCHPRAREYFEKTFK